MDCRGRKCTTVPHGDVCHPTSTQDRVRVDIKEKGLSGAEVYDRATWRRMSSYINPGQSVRVDIKEKGLSGEEVYDRATWRRMSSYINPGQSKG